jgi:hypothetical protein
MRLQGGALLLAALLGAGCFASRPVATPADLDRLGTRHYADRAREEVTAGAVTALKVLGYEVITTDPRIRTSPKDVATTATGTRSSAQTYTEAVAWDIDVQAEGAGSVLRATPRASVNGQPMEQVYVSWAETNYAQLMKEIDASLPAKK